MPVRVQRKRKKGFKLPDNTVCCTRGTKYGNPFKVGGWFKIGVNYGGFGFAWTQAREGYQDSSFTFIKDNETAVEMYRKYLEIWPLRPAEINVLSKADRLACFCPLDTCCHVDVIIDFLANQQ